MSLSPTGMPLPSFITQLNSSHISRFGSSSTFSRIYFVFILRLKENFNCYKIIKVRDYNSILFGIGVAVVTYNPQIV